jgi:bifunctional aspartokinase / homoserine dehydrogenase 1
MKVLKFGGSSVGSPDRIRLVQKIVESQQESCIVVVSAFQGITDQLIRMSRMAVERDDTFRSELAQLELRHLSAVRELIDPRTQSSILAQVKLLVNELEDILNGVFLLKDLTPKTSDFILSFGEHLSAYIISHVIHAGKFHDARLFIRTNSNYGAARVDFDLTDDLICRHFSVLDHTPIVPGFIARNEVDETTTLGRGGSDYTAAIIAAALNASVLEIWTDVDGFMTADPRKVSKAYAIDTLSYAEAIELSHFGAKVIYTPTIHPVYKKSIPVAIKNTFNPGVNGTLIGNNLESNINAPIKGISSIDDISMITIQGAGMVGVSGISMRVFRALAKSKSNVVLITQASSEYSISVAVSPSDAQRAKEAIEEEFQTEVFIRNEIKVMLEDDLSVIAIVGERMKNTPGISSGLFNSLSRNGVSVIATAQGSSELNISVVIRKISLRKALNAIHEGFFLSHFKELHLFLIGIGNVGKNLLQQVQSQKNKLLEDHRLKVNVTGIANSRKMLINADGIDLENFRTELDSNGQPYTIDDFVLQMAKLNLRNSVLIDCTANENVAAIYHKVFDYYVSVVTANKIACSSEYEVYNHLKNKARKKGVRFMFETNVGAGLPIINTINDLIRSGDKILKIEAVLSGTLNFIFNTLSEDIPLSKAILLAKEKGYSEPDPRIDLSGTDVIRKLLILARESGYTTEKEEVQINSFLPPECFEGTLEEFWVKVKKFDTEFENKRKFLAAENKKLRFVASLDRGKPSIELKEVTSDHPFYHLEGSNNIITLTTERYYEQPMIIKGYGAGAEVTAAGVFADVIRVANV